MHTGQTATGTEFNKCVEKEREAQSAEKLRMAQICPY